MTRGTPFAQTTVICRGIDLQRCAVLSGTSAFVQHIPTNPWWVWHLEYLSIRTSINLFSNTVAHQLDGPVMAFHEHQWVSLEPLWIWFWPLQIGNSCQNLDIRQNHSPVFRLLTQASSLLIGERDTPDKRVKSQGCKATSNNEQRVTLSKSK